MRNFLIMIIVGMGILAGCVNSKNTPIDTNGDKTIKPTESQENSINYRENLSFEFIKNELISQHGGVRTNYLDTPHRSEYATGSEILSESQGLLMLYALNITNKELFAETFAFVNDYLNLEETISYRYDDDGRTYYVNSSIDDMRIIRALIFAGDEFDKEYIYSADNYAARLYDTNVENGFMYDMYDQQYKIKNDFITLCYIDLYTMNLMQDFNRKWGEVFQNMSEIISNGYISDEFPFFKTSYSYSLQTYLKSDINMVEALLSVLNLARVDKCPQTTINYLKKQVEKGDVYGSYSMDGEKQTDVQSTAIYALCALIGAEVKDEDLLNDSIARMNELQVMDKNNPTYGGFANSITLEAYSFDNLLALLAYNVKANYK